MAGLYPLKFEPILKERVWGGSALRSKYGKESSKSKMIGESWEISGLQGDLSVVSNGYLAGNNLEEIAEVYMGDLMGEAIYNKFGREFPLLIKLIDASDKLSVQVHPGDEIARKRHSAYGKTEMWYVLEADSKAYINAGFIAASSENEFDAAIKNGNPGKLLNYIHPSAGDVFYIPSGRVHTLGGGVVIVEIQQTSDITYRIYDWNRTGLDGKPRELHRDLAKDVIDYNKSTDHYQKTVPVDNEAVELIACRYFITSFIKLHSDIERDYSKYDSFIIYICTYGKAEIEYNSEKTYIKQGETVLIPASIENLRLKSDQAGILEIYIDENFTQKNN